MRRDVVIERLRQHQDDIKRFAVRRIFLFGSTARDEARPESDIDLLVDFEGPATFRGFFGLQAYLEDLLGRPVDLVTRNTLRDFARPSIERDAILVA